MPYPNEHAARINSPDKYTKLRRNNDEFGKGIDVIYGVTKDGKAEVQAIRFDKEKFTPEAAKKWLKDHDYSSSGFEEAKEQKNDAEKKEPPMKGKMTDSKKNSEKEKDSDKDEDEDEDEDEDKDEDEEGK